MSIYLEGYRGTKTFGGEGIAAGRASAMGGGERNWRAVDALDDLIHYLDSAFSFDLIQKMAKEQSYREAQMVLNERLLSPFFLEKLDFIKRRAGLKEMSRDDFFGNNFEANRLNLFIERDGESLPLRICLHYGDRICKVDLVETLKFLERAKGVDINYLRDEELKAMQGDVKGMKKRLKLESTPDSEKEHLLEEFNRKWKGKFTATLKEGHGLGKIEVKDPLEFLDTCWKYCTVSPEREQVKQFIKERRSANKHWRNGSPGAMGSTMPKIVPIAALSTLSLLVVAVIINSCRDSIF